MATLIPLLLWVALLLGALCGVWMMVLGFKRHWAWGASLIVPQIAEVLFVIAYLRNTAPPEAVYLSLSLIGTVVYLAFLVVAWADAKQPFFSWLGSLLLMALFFVAVLKSDQRLSPQVARVLRAKGVTQQQINALELVRLTSPVFNRGRVAGASSSRASRYQGGDSSDFATPPPVFQSRLPTPSVSPGVPEPPQPGIYYLLERVTTKSAQGVQHGLPGERVILLERLPGDKMKVTIGNSMDFIVKKSQLTDDINMARELEKQDFVARGGQL